ncbi:cupin domain-containing protein [Thermostichus vulcanus]|uniref:Cupin domain-containing protein n=1 Tax=Thermostichus vulcanus str. 'Rupite' TaxID=2813851 RepID=A0ABT0C7N3_THEVL|nr:cupin domain-containing protein [Thermostichus vulcanus]MCJ2541722.1 cupin domain-containing protein [Thermostichus vulcanus str. 'Rupite']
MQTLSQSFSQCVIPVIKTPADYQAFRISPNDSNRLAIVFDPSHSQISLTFCVEIFDEGGKTPPNRHQLAVEMFFILKGEGVAICDGKAAPIKAGDSLLVPPTGVHEIHNTGPGRLYALCIMVPNEDFAELIRAGTPAELDEDDLQVLSGCWRTALSVA